MTFRHLHIFEVVCRHMSITRAAEELYISQPAVSLAISEIEKNYDIQLFERIGRRIYLTTTGERLLDYAHKITRLMEEMELCLREGTQTSVLRIGASLMVGSCLIPHCARLFSERYPEIRVQIRVGGTEVIEQEVLNNALDLGFVEGVPTSERLLILPFSDDEMAVVCPPDSPLLAEAPITCQRLAHLPLLLRETGSGTRMVVDKLMESRSLTLQAMWESPSTMAIIRGVQEGLGVSILPLRLVQPYLERGELAVLTMSDIQWKRKLYRIQHRDKILSKSAEDWCELMVGCAQNLDAPGTEEAKSRDEEE